MTTRTIVKFGKNGERFVHENVAPTPFGPDRAKELWAAAKAIAHYGPVSDQLNEVMTLGELAYVRDVWDAIPSGSSCWMSAFWAIEHDNVNE